MFGSTRGVKIDFGSVEWF